MRTYSLKQMGGFSLVELMIALVVVAILMSVALPSFLDQLRKGHRSDAMVLLMDVHNRQEQYMLDNSTYSSGTKNLGFAADPAISPEGMYQVKVEAATSACPISRCYELEAKPASGSSQLNDKDCALYTLNHRGQKKAYDSSLNDNTADCW